jgi:hypothetical protein
MANAPSALVNLSITGRDVISSGLKAGVIPTPVLQYLDLSNGVNDGQIDLLYYKQESGIAASSTTSYDLAGSLTDAEGTVLTFAEIALIYLYNRRNTALAYLDLGPHATNGFGRLASSRGFWPADVAADADQGTIVAPLSFVVLYSRAGVPVTAGTGDILRVLASGVTGSTNAWDILLLGRSS